MMAKLTTLSILLTENNKAALREKSLGAICVNQVPTNAGYHFSSTEYDSTDNPNSLSVLAIL